MTDDALDWRRRLYRVADKHGMTGADHATIIAAADALATLTAELDTCGRAREGWYDRAAKAEAEAKALRGLLLLARGRLLLANHKAKVDDIDAALAAKDEK